MRTSMRNRVRNLELLARANRSQLEAEKLLAGIAQELWEHLNTPLSLGLSLLARNGQWKDVVSQEFNPGRYLETELETARNDYQAVAFLRKCPLVIAGVDRKKRALDNFVKAEQQCAQTNARFRNMRSGIYDSTVEPVLHLAQRKISSWLGDYISAEFWASSCRFGPGADNLNKGNSVGPYHKLSRISATADFADCAQALVRDHPAWARSVDGRAEGEIPLYVPVDIARGNTVTFVPKTAMIDRSIAIEPQMNIFGQLGLGKLLRTALKRNGLDLDDQGPNQVLAQQGSIDGTVVTIDLSAASDTLAREVVRELVPEKWYFALDLCRSKTGTYRDDEGEISFRYEKFSSMGNGFTFELESMIFYALTLSVCDHLGLPTDQVRAYGDDITAPSGAVELLGKVLTFCGFTVNEQKSYTTSVRFRESCGADFFNGVNIRPYFCKELPTNAICLIRMANGIRRVAARRNCGYGCDDRLRASWIYVVHRIPRSLRDLKGPFRTIEPPTGGSWFDVECGDGYLGVNFDEALTSTWFRRNSDQREGWLFAELGAQPFSFKATEWHKAYVTALYLCRDGVAEKKKETLDRFTDRGSNPRRLNWRREAPSWLDLGPWV